MTIISYNCQFIFIHTPKCGGTSIETAWQDIGRWGDFVIGSTPEGERLQSTFTDLYGLAKHTTARDLKRVTGRNLFDQFETIAVVRNPISVVESHYRFALVTLDYYTSGNALEPGNLRKLIEDREESLPKWWFLMADGLLADAMVSDTFEEFLERAADKRWKKCLMPFTHDGKGNQLVDTVLQIEQPRQIEHKFNALISSYHEQLGRRWYQLADNRRYRKRFRLPHLNKGKAVKTKWPRQQLIRYCEIMEREFEVFRYEFPV